MSREGRRRRTQSEENAALKAEVQRLRSTGIGNNITKVVLAVIKWGAYVLMAFYASTVLLSYAGKVTIADVKFSATATADAKTRTETAQRFDLAVESAAKAECDARDNAALIALMIGGLTTLGSLLYARSNARLRKSTIERLAHYQREYEKLADPGRSSSKLTRRGETNPEDE
jgi:hypothetical protein